MDPGTSALRARLRRAKASLAGRGLQEAPFAVIMMGRSCCKLGRSLRWGSRGWGGGAKPASHWLQLNAGPHTAGLALPGVIDPSQWK